MQRIKDLLTADDAVSPVIGVILMVAITVILAAVIAAFVLGIGDTDDVAPQTSFDSSVDGDTLVIEIASGDSIDEDNLEIRSLDLGSGETLGNCDDSDGPTEELTTCTTQDPSDGEWGVGESIEFDSADGDFDFNLVWTGDGDDVLKTVEVNN